MYKRATSHTRSSSAECTPHNYLKGSNKSHSIIRRFRIPTTDLSSWSSGNLLQRRGTPLPLTRNRLPLKRNLRPRRGSIDTPFTFYTLSGLNPHSSPGRQLAVSMTTRSRNADFGGTTGSVMRETDFCIAGTAWRFCARMCRTVSCRSPWRRRSRM